MRIGKLKVRLNDLLIYVMLLFVVTQFLNLQVFWSGILIVFIILMQVVPSLKLYRVPVFQWGILILTFVTYFSIYKQNNVVQQFRYMTYLIGPPLFYYCGMIFVKRYKGDFFVDKFENVMLILSLGGTFYSLACCINKYLHYGQYLSLITRESIYSSMQSRYALDIWSGNLFQPTNLNSYCIFAVLSLYPALAFVESKKKKRMFCLSVIIAVVVCFISGSRTNLLLLLIAFLLGMFLTGDFGKKTGVFALTKGKILGFFCIVLIALIFSEQIAAVIQNSSLGTRLNTEHLTISSDGRWERMRLVLDHILDYPFGNMPYNEAHNLWLDTARVTGIIPMGLMMAFTFSVLFNALKLNKNRECIDNIRIWIVIVIFIMFISFMIEPVLEGRPYIFMLFCFLAGISCCVLKNPITLDSIHAEKFK